MLIERARRNRKTAAVRQLVQEHHLRSSDFVAPLFVKEGRRESIFGMPGICSYGLDELLSEVERIAEAKIPAVALFPLVSQDLKDEKGQEALNPQNTLHRAVCKIKERFPHICVITDVALDPYTTHGHDGIIDEGGEVLNDETVSQLVKMALLAADAGVDMVAPSDMMDGRVAAIRRALDNEGFTNVNILSYAIKYASSLYGPFRNAVGSPLKYGAKASYQLNPANCKEALREGLLDEKEGADILMVKPAGFYLDVIAKLKSQTLLPVAAFQVSGEYAMLAAAAAAGLLDFEKALLESLLCIKRAGADMIITWAALQSTLIINHIVD